MNTQTFAQDPGFTAIADNELMAVNGGILWGPSGGVFGGMMQGAAANAVGVELDAGAAGNGAGLGRMIFQH